MKSGDVAAFVDFDVGIAALSAGVSAAYPIVRPLRDSGRSKIMINVRALAGALTVAAFGAVGLVWVYRHRGVTVVLRNKDSASLADVTVHVTGADYPIGDMPSGSTRTVLVAPTGESHIEISQQQAGGRGRIRVGCYFDAGDSGTIDLDVSRTSVAVVDNQISVGLW